MSTLEEFARSRGYVIRVDRGPRGDEAPVREFVLTSADVAEIAQLQARVAELEAALSTVLVGAECHADFSNGVVCPSTGADQGEATASEILRECRAVLERKS